MLIAPGGNRVGSVGRLAPGTEARIVDPVTGQDAAEGELWVRGPQVMLGYHNNPDATARTLSPEGWLHTGDLATAGEGGYFTILDRVKELIKVSRFQVAPVEVEAALLTHPDVADAAVTAIPDDETGERPKAHVVAKPGTDLTAEAIPKSASGKILRRLLKG